jgi:hypothetical protein
MPRRAHPVRHVLPDPAALIRAVHQYECCHLSIPSGYVDRRAGYEVNAASQLCAGLDAEVAEQWKVPCASFVLRGMRGRDSRDVGSWMRIILPTLPGGGGRRVSGPHPYVQQDTNLTMAAP